NARIRPALSIAFIGEDWAFLTATVARRHSDDRGGMVMARSAMSQLQDQVVGQVVAAGDAGYDEARVVYNAMIDRRPQAVVRCTGTDDVRAAVIYAHEHGLDLAIRGGGHSVPGFGTVDDGIVIDLSGLRRVTVDPRAATARAEGGATWSDFNDATHAYGL